MLKNYKDLKVWHELESQALLAGDLGYIGKGELATTQEDVAETERML